MDVVWFCGLFVMAFVTRGARTYADLHAIKTHVSNHSQEVRGRKAVVVLLVDLLDASGTLMAKVRGSLAVCFRRGAATDLDHPS